MATLKFTASKSPCTRLSTSSLSMVFSMNSPTVAASAPGPQGIANSGESVKQSASST